MPPLHDRKAELAFLLSLLRRVDHVWLMAGASIFLSISVTVIEALGLFAIVPILESIGSRPLGHENTALDPILGLLRNADGTVSIERVAYLLIFVALVKPLFTFCASYAANVLPIELRKVIFRDLVHKQLRTRLVVLNKEPTGNWTSAYHNFISSVCGIVSTFVGSVTQVFLFFLYIGIMWIASPSAVMLSVAFIVALWLATKWMADLQGRIGTAITKTAMEFQQAALQMLQGMRLIRTIAAEDRKEKEIYARLMAFVRYYYHAVAVASLMQPIIALTSGLLIGTMLLYGDSLFDGAQADWLGALILFVVVFYRVLGPATALYGARISISQEWASVRELRRLFLLCDDNLVPRGTALIPEDKSKDLVVDGLSFSFDDARVLNGVSFRIPAGQKVAIVGRSGAGKSTLAMILARLYEYDSGSITVSGVEISQIDHRHYAQHVGYVSQEVVIFNETVRENFNLVVPGIPDTDIWTALEMVDLADYFRSTPEGLETKLEEGGMRLSGGQRQRIGIARMLVARRAIVVLDEPTSQLDSHSEAIIQRSLERLGSSTTLITIAHRLSTIQAADQIIVLHEGRVVEIGRHGDLVRGGGLYAEMVRYQEFSAEGPN